MTKVGVAGSGSASGIESAEAVSTTPGTGAASAAEGSSTTEAATPRTRVASVNMQTLGLESQLNARLGEAGAADSTGETAKAGSVEELGAAVKAIPREKTATAETAFNAIREMLDGRVKEKETEKILSVMGRLTPGEWMHVMDRLRSEPSGSGSLSLAEKLFRRGIGDKNDFIERFAEQASKKLGLGLQSRDEREKELSKRINADSLIGRGRVDRIAGRELRDDAKVMLDYFDCKDKQGFLKSLQHGAVATGETIGNIVAAPVILAIFLIESR